MLQHSRTDPGEEIADLRRARQLVRGPLLADVPRGQLTWLARETLECDVPSLVVDATHRLATVLLDSRDAAGSTQAVHAGLRLAGRDQVLWRDLIRADIAPQTHALLGELLPTRSLSF